jgi:hypothetical protein
MTSRLGAFTPSHGLSLRKAAERGRVPPAIYVQQMPGDQHLMGPSLLWSKTPGLNVASGSVEGPSHPLTGFH